MNQITIHGYLGKDPEIEEKTGQKGTYKRVTFSVGVSRAYGDQTDWFYCVLIGKRAEVLEKYFHKGSQIILSGSMESYKTDRDNMLHWLVKVTDFDFCDKASTANSNASTSQTQTSTEPSTESTPESMEEVDEDVPF